MPHQTRSYSTNERTLSKEEMPKKKRRNRNFQGQTSVSDMKSILLFGETHEARGGYSSPGTAQ